MVVVCIALFLGVNLVELTEIEPVVARKLSLLGSSSSYFSASPNRWALLDMSVIDAVLVATTVAFLGSSSTPDNADSSP